MDKIIKLEDKSLSSADIMRIMGGMVQIIAYPDLEKYNSVEQLFKSSNNIILFFEEDKKGSSNIGHWEAICKRGNVIEFFDSYGLAVDKCRDWLTKNKLIQLKETKPELTRLTNKAIDDGYFLLWNHIQYQSYKKDVSTCGRWATAFLLEGDLRNNVFLDFVKSIVRKYNAKSYDEAVTKWSFENWKV